MRGSLDVRGISPGFRRGRQGGRVNAMPASQLIFFLIWLVTALAAGVALYVVWQRLYARFAAARQPEAAQDPRVC
jgi:hypothetical protein